MTETPKVSCKYPEERGEVDDEVEETLGAMDASWHQDFSDNLHWISTNPNISESIRGVFQSYKKLEEIDSRPSSNRRILRILENGIHFLPMLNTIWVTII